MKFLSEQLYWFNLRCEPLKWLFWGFFSLFLFSCFSKCLFLLFYQMKINGKYKILTKLPYTLTKDRTQTLVDVKSYVLPIELSGPSRQAIRCTWIRWWPSSLIIIIHRRFVNYFLVFMGRIILIWRKRKLSFLYLWDAYLIWRKRVFNFDANLF